MTLTSDLHANQYETLIDAINDLNKKGYTHSFQIRDMNAYCLENDTAYPPSELSIVEYHRFEGETGPQDMSIVYVVECTDGIKGSIIDAYGTYSNDVISEFMDKVSLA